MPMETSTWYSPCRSHRRTRDTYSDISYRRLPGSGYYGWVGFHRSSRMWRWRICRDLRYEWSSRVRSGTGDNCISAYNQVCAWDNDTRDVLEIGPETRMAGGQPRRRDTYVESHTVTITDEQFDAAFDSQEAVERAFNMLRPRSDSERNELNGLLDSALRAMDDAVAIDLGAAEARCAEEFYREDAPNVDTDEYQTPRDCTGANFPE